MNQISRTTFQFFQRTKEVSYVLPFWYSFVILYPVLIGFFIQFQITEIRSFLIYFAWISPFIFLYALGKKKWMYHGFLIIWFATGLIETLHWILILGPITTTSFLAISQTNLQESIEYITFKSSFRFLLIIPYLIAFVFAWKKIPEPTPLRQKHFLFWIILGSSLIFISENAIHDRLVRKGMPHAHRAFISFFKERELYREASKICKPRQIDVTSIPGNKTQTCILVLGESCNRNHMSLYGYIRNTNPKLGKRKDLIVYKDVITPYSNTLKSVLSMFSSSNGENLLNFENSIDLIDIFHSAGFKTYWISNQSPIGIWDNQVTTLARKSDQCTFVNNSANSSMESTLTISYDDKLFEPFQKALEDTAEKKFIVLHLMGSHTAYNKRHPGGFNIFSGTGKKEKTIAEYDNSILYNDFILDSLIAMASGIPEKGTHELRSLIYVSDHGENVYDVGEKAGHDYTQFLPRPNVEIPFLVWLSPGYFSWNPSKAKQIEANRNLPFMSDDLSHVMCDLFEIRNSNYDSSRSVFNSFYHPLRKRMMEDGQEYIRPIPAELHTLSIHIQNINTHDSLFQFFTEKLSFPVYYEPIQLGIRKYGGIFAGNLVLEPCGPYPDFRYATPDFRAIFYGLTFIPSYPISKSSEELNRKKVFHEVAGEEYIYIRDSLIAGQNIFISLMDRYEKQKDKLKRDSLRNGLLQQENPIDLVSVKEVQIGYSSGEVLNLWKAFFSTTEIPSTGIQLQPGGPALNFVLSSRDEVEGITFFVKSITKTKKFLSQKGVRWEKKGSEITILKSECFGLNISFTDQ